MPSVPFRLNGAEMNVDADPDRSLLDILRGQLGMTGPHFGCGAGECGACNVIIGDRPVAACDTPLWSVADKDVTTPEGLGSSERPHPLQRAFIAEQALQCGYCVSAILISAEGFGAAFAGGWAVANLLEFGTDGVHIFQAIFFILGIGVMIAFVRHAQEVEPFLTKG